MLEQLDGNAGKRHSLEHLETTWQLSGDAKHPPGCHPLVLPVSAAPSNQLPSSRFAALLAITASKKNRYSSVVSPSGSRKKCRLCLTLHDPSHAGGSPGSGHAAPLAVCAWSPRLRADRLAGRGRRTSSPRASAFVVKVAVNGRCLSGRQRRQHLPCLAGHSAVPVASPELLCERPRRTIQPLGESHMSCGVTPKQQTKKMFSSCKASRSRPTCCVIPAQWVDCCKRPRTSEKSPYGLGHF